MHRKPVGEERLEWRQSGTQRRGDANSHRRRIWDGRAILCVSRSVVGSRTMENAPRRRCRQRNALRIRYAPARPHKDSPPPAMLSLSPKDPHLTSLVPPRPFVRQRQRCPRALHPVSNPEPV